MRNVEIEVFPIAKTQVDREAVRSWLDYLGANEYEVPEKDAITDPALLIALASKRCYLSFDVGLNPNVTKIRKDLTEYLDNILKSGHGSVLEHAVWTFAIEGVSRVFSGEMNRHRAGVGISEGSMRYIRFDNIPWWIPLSMRLQPDEEKVLMGAEAGVELTVAGEALADLAYKKAASVKVFQDHFLATEKAYKALQDIWKEELAPAAKFHRKKQVTSMMRRIIPMGVATGGVWTLNMRALRHVIALRASEAAEEEICYVFCKIAKIMAEEEPMIFGDFTETPEGYWTPRYTKV
jgi:thymidylate synthase (FAD)